LKMGKRIKKRKKVRKPKKPVERIDLEMSELEGILARTAEGPLNEEDRGKLLAALETLLFLTQELEKKRVSVQRLKKLLFGASTETTRKVIEEVLKKANQGSAGGGSSGKEKGKSDPKKRKGHGRNGAEAYRGAEKVKVPHESLHPGEACPQCTKGKVYETAEPGRLVRVRGQAPLCATVYELQKLRCNLCGEVFTAKAAEGLGDQKYDAESASMIGLLKYGSGLPFNRLQGLQGSLGIPLPASTQWEIVEESARKMEPVFEELIRQAAQGKVLHHDDTTAKILSDRKEDPPEPGKEGSDRKGVFTTGIVSLVEGNKVALFFTGRKHAGENLVEVLKQRASGLPLPIQMCDALSRNMPQELKTLVANCLSHGRRRFVDVAPNFPEECLHVLEVLGKVYHNDAVTRKEGMTPEQRLRFHQDKSGPIMEELEQWMEAQFEEKKVEPNSGLGEAIAYLSKHWEKMTLFLRVPGAPLDNNICERALKKAILHRKNAYFYKTSNGARVGDLYMSFIHTCELNEANPFEYLTELQKHANELNSNPRDWMPWNYQETMEGRTAARTQ